MEDVVGGCIAWIVRTRCRRGEWEAQPVGPTEASPVWRVLPTLALTSLQSKVLHFAELFKRAKEDEKIVNMYVHLACFFGGYSYNKSNLSSHSVRAYMDYLIEGAQCQQQFLTGFSETTAVWICKIEPC